MACFQNATRVHNECLNRPGRELGLIDGGKDAGGDADWGEVIGGWVEMRVRLVIRAGRRRGAFGSDVAAIWQWFGSDLAVNGLTRAPLLQGPSLFARPHRPPP